MDSSWISRTLNRVKLFHTDSSDNLLILARDSRQIDRYTQRQTAAEIQQTWRGGHFRIISQSQRNKLLFCCCGLSNMCPRMVPRKPLIPHCEPWVRDRPRLVVLCVVLAVHPAQHYYYQYHAATKLSIQLQSFTRQGVFSLGFLCNSLLFLSCSPFFSLFTTQCFSINSTTFSPTPPHMPLSLGFPPISVFIVLSLYLSYFAIFREKA